MTSIHEALHGTLADLGNFVTIKFCYWAFLGLVLDALVGDPSFAWHPIRLLGRLLAFFEDRLFRAGLNGYFGGILLFVLLGVVSLAAAFSFLVAARTIHPVAFDIAAGIVVWACVALRDLIAHGERIARAVKKGDLPKARQAVSMLVGRDTDKMDLPACARGAVESLSENLVDGVLSPLGFAMAFGPLGAVLYKVVSTMDSMVGYKTERYLRFGWCGARFDDVANYLGARWSFLLISTISRFLPGFSGKKAWRTGRAFHAIVPGPNSGWPEASIAGALSIRLIGPLYKNGAKVCDVWIGEAGDPEGATPRHIRQSYWLLILSTFCTLLGGFFIATLLHHTHFDFDYEP